jgi:uncharacterized protein DUF6782
MICYRDLDESSALAAIHGGTRSVLLAGNAAAKAAMELGLTTPRLVWFIEAASYSPNLYTRPFAMKGEARALSNAIRLHVGLRDDDLLNTVAHECRHLWQFQRGALSRWAVANSDTDNAVAEADARSWAAAFVAKFNGTPINQKALEESPQRLLTDLHAALSQFGTEGTKPGRGW